MRYILLLFFLISILFANEHKQILDNKEISNYGFYSKGSFYQNLKTHNLH